MQQAFLDICRAFSNLQREPSKVLLFLLDKEVDDIPGLSFACGLLHAEIENHRVLLELKGKLEGVFSG
jgi:hypothetical protein